MADPMTGPSPRCPWCSAQLPIPGAVACAACGATLVTADEGPEPEIKGVTAIDPEAILRARTEAARPRSRLLSFLTGDSPTPAPSEAEAASVAPPPDEVRREMLRLRLEAERADIEAELIANKSDVLTRRGIQLGEAAGEPEPGADAPEDTGPTGDA